MNKLIKYSTYLLKLENQVCVKMGLKTQNIVESTDVSMRQFERKLNNLKLNVPLGKQLMKLTNEYKNLNIEFGIEEKIKLQKCNEKVSNNSILTVTYMIKDIENQSIELNDFMVFDLEANIKLNDVYEKVSAEILYEMEKKCNKLIDIPKKKEWNILFESEPASKLLHEILLHPLEIDFFEENFFPNGTIFSECFSLYDNCELENDFDDLCNKVVQNVSLVKNGKLKGRVLGETTGNIYIDYFTSLDSSELARTTKSVVTITEKLDLSKYNEYLIINKIDSGYFENSGIIYLIIQNASLYKNKNKYLIEPCILKMDIKNLVSKKVYSMGVSEWNKSLCMKKGQVHPVAMKCPQIMIEKVEFEQRSNIYD